MSEDSNNPYRTGYGKPPLETRFQPGKSGNPGGRPPRRKSGRETLFDELHRKLSKEVDGEKVETTILEGLIKRALKEAATDPNYFLKLMRWMEGYNPPPPEPSEEERALEILKDFAG